MGFYQKHTERDKVAMGTVDKLFELRPETSTYYAIMIEKMGKELADYYWNRRHDYEKENDYEYIKICREITAKSEAFLKRRKVKFNTLNTLDTRP